MFPKILIYLLLIIISYPLFGNNEDNYPIILEKKNEINGELYKLPNSKFVIIKNNWIDKTTTISIYDSSLVKKSLILNNTDIKDFYSTESTYSAIATSNRRAFLTIFNDDFSVKKIHLLDTNISNSDDFNIVNQNDNLYYIQKNNELSSFDVIKKTKQLISNRYIKNSFIKLDSVRFYYLKFLGNVTYLIENINNKYEKELLRVEPTNDYSINIINNRMILKCHYASNTHLLIYSLDLKLIEDFWIDEKSNNIVINSNKDETINYVLTFVENNFAINELDNKLVIKNSFEFPNNIISPLLLQKSNNSIIVLFQNAIYCFDEQLNILFNKTISVTSNYNNHVIKIVNFNDVFAISVNEYTYIFKKSENTFWRLKYYWDKFISYIIPIILLIIIFVLYYLFSKKKELNSTLLELSDNDFIFVFNKKGDLININKTAKTVIEIDSSIPLGRYFKYYCISEHTKELYEIFEKMKSVKENFQQKIHIFHNEELHEYICNAVTKRRATGSIVGYLISGTDITEELKQQKMNNFAQLAHDMQTNLSTLKLNAEDLESTSEQSDLKKQKIIKQINILNQKVRDIVTVGRSSNVHKAKHNSKQIILEVLDEFDREYFNNITFIDESVSFEFYCDKQKLSRALRNATENSLKSMKDKQDGILKIKTYKNSKYAYFEIVDNGKGMNKEVKGNMLKPFYTSAGGTGLGTMIMRNAIEQHGGEIIIESEVGKGTTISFKIPIT